MSIRPVIIIPARMGSTRLPGKPLADIHGKPMIVRVYEQVHAATDAPVFIACGEPIIADTVHQAGGKAILTNPALPSGTDRVWEALQKIDPDNQYTHIINVQGDLPLLGKEYLAQLFMVLSDPATDIATLASPLLDPIEVSNPSVVKAIVALKKDENVGRALYFTRAMAPYGEGPFYHHIGLYGFKRASLERFVHLPVSPLEKRESLEQLRALEAGMCIQVGLVHEHPLSVDTLDDLTRARLAIFP